MSARRAHATAPDDATLRATPGAEQSPKRLRALLRTSPLIAPEMRAHWLRVLPHLSAEQRAELALLLDAEGPNVGIVPNREDAPGA